MDDPKKIVIVGGAGRAAAYTALAAEREAVTDNYGYVVVDTLTGEELATIKEPYEGNRKERRAQAALARDKRWRIKL